MNGGYIMIDCKGLELTTESGQTIPGLYQRVKDAMKTYKPIYAYNIFFATNPASPIAVMANHEPGTINYICTACTLQIKVAPDDSVTIINMIQP